jgi:hypothetical protein
VVQFPERALPDFFKEKTEPIIYLGPEEYEEYYSLIVGYSGRKDKPVNQAEVL